jgi:hypothetical protein
MSVYIAPPRFNLSRQEKDQYDRQPKHKRKKRREMTDFLPKAGIRKSEHATLEAVDAAARLRAEKRARLRKLRLAKEAEEAGERQAAAETKATGKKAIKKQRP